MISYGGYVNKELFVEWLKHIAKHARPTEDYAVLLIVDSHMSHSCLEAKRLGIMKHSTFEN
jgi:DDE superfamily endonuclease.